MIHCSCQELIYTQCWDGECIADFPTPWAVFSRWSGPECASATGSYLGASTLNLDPTLAPANGASGRLWRQGVRTTPTAKFRPRRVAARPTSGHLAFRVQSLNLTHLPTMGLVRSPTPAILPGEEGNHSDSSASNSEFQFVVRCLYV